MWWMGKCARVCANRGSCKTLQTNDVFLILQIICCTIWRCDMAPFAFRMCSATKLALCTRTKTMSTPPSFVIFCCPSCFWFCPAIYSNCSWRFVVHMLSVWFLHFCHDCFQSFLPPSTLGTLHGALFLQGTLPSLHLPCDALRWASGKWHCVAMFLIVVGCRRTCSTTVWPNSMGGITVSCCFIVGSTKK